MERQSKESRGLEAHCRGGQGPPRVVAPSGGGRIPFTSRPVGRPKSRWEDVRNDLRKMKLLKWTEQVQDRSKWKAIVEKAKTLSEL